MSDPIEDLKRYGIHLEADLGPTPHHRRIVKAQPIQGTRSGQICELECGHVVHTYGDHKHSRGGTVLCTECRKEASPPALGEVQIFKVQRPVVATPGDMREIYIYNESRSLTYQGQVPERVIKKLFPKGEYKVFCYGKAAEGGVLELDREAPWQEW
jgi:hypothetical protein